MSYWFKVYFTAFRHGNAEIESANEQKLVNFQQSTDFAHFLFYLSKWDWSSKGPIFLNIWTKYEVTFFIHFSSSQWSTSPINHPFAELPSSNNYTTSSVFLISKKSRSSGLRKKLAVFVLIQSLFSPYLRISNFIFLSLFILFSPTFLRISNLNSEVKLGKKRVSLLTGFGQLIKACLQILP